MKKISFKNLVGECFSSIEVSEDRTQVIFKSAYKATYYMRHKQSCREVVKLEDICGDLSDLIDSEILVASEEANIQEDILHSRKDTDYLWTFYTLRTMRGTVTFRWLGSSNECYAMDVDVWKEKSFSSTQSNTNTYTYPKEEKTLRQAIQDSNFETVKLLLKNGMV
jgi:hypothetical protein